MKPKIDLPDRETRFLTGQVEIRAAAETEKPRVRGYAAKFNVESEILGTHERQFREVIAPGAFDNVLGDDVRALFNHDPNFILARAVDGKGTLTIGVDETGLFYEFEPPDTQAGRDLVVSINRGDITQSSFSFTVEKDNWEGAREGDGTLIARRTIEKFGRLYDVSPVTYPAYPDATVALRSLQEFRGEQEPPADDPPASEPSQEQLSEAGDWAARIGLPE